LTDARSLASALPDLLPGFHSNTRKSYELPPLDAECLPILGSRRGRTNPPPKISPMRKDLEESTKARGRFPERSQPHGRDDDPMDTDDTGRSPEVRLDHSPPRRPSTSHRAADAADEPDAAAGGRTKPITVQCLRTLLPSQLSQTDRKSMIKGASNFMAQAARYEGRKGRDYCIYGNTGQPDSLFPALRACPNGAGCRFKHDGLPTDWRWTDQSRMQFFRDHSVLQYTP